VAPVRSCVNRRFGDRHRLYLQGRKIHERGTSVSRWLADVPPKHRFTQDIHGATSQKTAFFRVTAAKNSNPIYRPCFTDICYAFQTKFLLLLAACLIAATAQLTTNICSQVCRNPRQVLCPGPSTAADCKEGQVFKKNGSFCGCCNACYTLVGESNVWFPFRTTISKEGKKREVTQFHRTLHKHQWTASLILKEERKLYVKTKTCR
jgi:hypothetical protein